MDSKRLEISLTAKGGDARLEDLIAQLNAVRKALSDADRIAGRSVHYKVVGISHNSPYNIILEPEAANKKETASDVELGEGIDIFTDTLDTVQRGEDVGREYDSRALSNLKPITNLLGSKFEAIRIKGGHKDVELKADLPALVDQLIGPDIVTLGTVKGTIERINIHLDENTCAIFPIVGADKVICDFPKKLRSQFAEAVDKYVSVFGELRYKRRDHFPYSIKAETVRVLVVDPNLPDLADMRGIAPNMTNGVPSDQFVKENRDAWR